MALRLEDKKAIVAELSDVAKNAISAAAADYRGLSVTQMNELRATARNSGVYLKVIRNTLARRAVKDTDFACLEETFVGPVLLAFSENEPSAAARLFKDFAKSNDKLEVTALAVGGKLYGASDLNAIASLPTRDEALAQLMGTLKAPISKFVRTMAEPHAKFVRTLAAVRDKKQAEG